MWIILLVGLVACESSEPANEVELPWIAQSGTVSNAVLLELQSSAATLAVQSRMSGQGVEAAHVALYNHEGLTTIDLRLSTSTLGALQRLQPTEQTAKLQTMREDLFAVVLGSVRSAGLYGIHSDDEDGGAAAFLAQRATRDLVLSVGWRVAGADTLYATVYDDHVSFDPDAPRATVATAAAPDDKKKAKGAKAGGLFDQIKKQAAAQAMKQVGLATN
jgi:hypothetical protein